MGLAPHNPSPRQGRALPPRREHPKLERQFLYHLARAELVQPAWQGGRSCLFQRPLQPSRPKRDLTPPGDPFRGRLEAPIQAPIEFGGIFWPAGGSLLLLALNVLLFLVLCAGVGALGASSAFAEIMVTLI